MNTDIFPDKTVLFATHNKKKIIEVQAMFEPYGITVISAADKNLPEPDETGVTFAENAELKAVAAARTTGLPAIADDSGFCCEALYGGPGIYSARFAAARGGWNGGMQAVLDAAKTNPAKTAWFITVMCLALPNGESYFFEGIVKGSLAQSMRGTGGFGYDPIFIPDGRDRTFGEMTEEEKNNISHRKLAFNAFIKACL